MKGIINKFAFASIVFLAAWVVAYGTVHAQPVCCVATVVRCQPAFKGMMIGKTLFSLPCTPSHRFNTPQLNDYSSADTSIQYDTGVACCEANSCDDTNQAVYAVPSSPKPTSWLFTTPIYNTTAANEANPSVTVKTTIPLQTIPIYILKSTYLC